MNRSVPMFAWGRLARIVALGASALLLAGCVVPYSYVQAGYGGGYYTSSGPAPGYYYDQPGYAYYGGGYGYAYGPPVGLSLSLTSGWGWPSYYGYRHPRHWSHGGRWQHASGAVGHDHWNGSSSQGWSRPAGGNRRWQTRAERPMPAPRRPHGPSIKRP